MTTGFNSVQAKSSGIPLNALFGSAAQTAKSVTHNTPQIPLRSTAQNVRIPTEIAQRLVITHSKDWWSIVSEFVLIGGSLAALGYMFKSLVNNQNDPEKNKKIIAEHVKRVLLKKMKKSGRSLSNFQTNPYEDSLLDLIVLPNSIDVKFNDIGGLESIKSDLTETVLVPLIYPQLTGSSKLCAPPLGVLFHGPPGTGKSMMAKAIARETNATFFNVDMSRLMSKWYGDSQKYISALFSLARKMAPSIIWIDEIDALFSQRSRSDHSADVYNKALFLSLWDGLSSDIYKYNANKNKINKNKINTNETSQVIILGASNRPQQVDEAFLRRMSRQYEFIMPDNKTRKLILTILLQTENIHQNVDLTDIANKTNFYSGSDLKELCKYAATLPLREYVRNKSGKTSLSPSYDNNNNENNENQSKYEYITEKNKNNETPGNNGWFSFGLNSKNYGNTNDGSKSHKKNQIFKKYQNEKESFKLRSIQQNDLLIGLKHIKSTMKSHQGFSAKYDGKKSLFGNIGMSDYSQYFGLNNNSNSVKKNNNPNKEDQNQNVDVDDDNVDDNDNDVLELD